MRKWIVLACCLLLISLLLASQASRGLESLRPTLAFPQLPNPSEAYDINGKLIGALTPEYRKEVSLEEVSPYFREAIVAIEDNRFYRHPGIDPLAIARALLVNLREASIVEGGSTITQQTAKNLYLSQERTWTRKLKELYYSLLLERYLTKGEILELYVNNIYFGHGAYGVESAAQTFFNKPARDLTLAESALLAGLTRSPSAYSPYLHPDNAKYRRDRVLQRMVEVGRLDADQAAQAMAQPVAVVESSRPTRPAAYVLQAVRDYLVNKYPETASQLPTAGMKVYTTIDLGMQQAAEDAFYNGMKNQPADLEGALVAVDPQNGQVRALVGGRSLSRGEFNRALEAYRQPGSAFKPFLYTAAIDLGYTPASMITCDPAAFPLPDGSVYQPTDYGDQPYHYRPFTLKEAIMVSDNVVSVKLNQQVGPANTVEYARRMGIRSVLQPYLSIALGTFEVTPLELAAAYCPLANGGSRVEPFFILRVEDGTGRVLEENQPRLTAAISPQTAYIVIDMLKGVLQPGGTASHLARVVGRAAAGKTGTTNERRDAWFVGCTPDLVTAVYAGYDTPDRPVGVGGRVAGPIWAEFTREALKEVPPRDFPVPPGVVSLKICASTGAVATPECPRPIEMVFRQGTEPGWSPWWYQSLLPGEGREAYLINELLFNRFRFPGWLLRG